MALSDGRSDKSRSLKALHKKEDPVVAHQLLLDLGLKDAWYNPHPTRFEQTRHSARTTLESPCLEGRRDISHLSSWAIDNEWSADPDDAIGWDGQYLYVHVSDPASAIAIDSPADLEARDRGASLYLPETTWRMLSPEATQAYALGLDDRSPAFTFKIALDDELKVQEVEIFPSIIRAKRLSYTQASQRKDDKELAPLFALAQRLEAGRKAAGAIEIELPEVHIVVDPSTDRRKVDIFPVPDTDASKLVREFMLLAGRATARLAIDSLIPLPFVSQEVADIPKELPPGFAGAWALRKCMRKRQLSARPGRHAGLGLNEYTQVTSPLRRYTDLVCHQELRAWLEGKKGRSMNDILEHIARADAAMRQAQLAERASRRHWTLVHLLEAPPQSWQGIIVEIKGSMGIALIPALALDVAINLPPGAKLNDEIPLALGDINLPKLEVQFYPA